jgi:hypothetical protein
MLAPGLSFRGKLQPLLQSLEQSENGGSHNAVAYNIASLVTAVKKF